MHIFLFLMLYAYELLGCHLQLFSEMHYSSKLLGSYQSILLYKEKIKFPGCRTWETSGIYIATSYTKIYYKHKGTCANVSRAPIQVVFFESIYFK